MSMSSFPCLLRAWNTNEGKLRNYQRHRAGDAHLADDLLQEVFVRAVQQGRDFCSLDNSRAWLFQVARNALIDQHRTRREVVELPEDIPQPEISHEPIQALGACVVRVLSDLHSLKKFCILFRLRSSPLYHKLFWSSEMSGLTLNLPRRNPRAAVRTARGRGQRDSRFARHRHPVLLLLRRAAVHRIRAGGRCRCPAGTGDSQGY